MGSRSLGYACLLLLTITPALRAQCDIIARNGLFESASLTTVNDKASSFANWARDRKESLKTTSNATGFSLGIPGVGDIGFSGANQSGERFWEDVEAGSSGTAEQKMRLVSYATRVSQPLVAALDHCLTGQGLHFYLEATPDPTTFIVTAHYVPEGRRVPAVQLYHLNLLPTTLQCDLTPFKDNILIGPETHTMACVRTDTTRVLVTANAEVTIHLDGTLFLPPIILHRPTPGSTISDTILRNATDWDPEHTGYVGLSESFGLPMLVYVGTGLGSGTLGGPGVASFALDILPAQVGRYHLSIQYASADTVPSFVFLDPRTGPGVNLCDRDSTQALFRHKFDQPTGGGGSAQAKWEYLGPVDLTSTASRPPHSLMILRCYASFPHILSVRLVREP